MQQEVYPQDAVIHFPEGLPGFEGICDYILWREEDAPLVMTLQAVGLKYPAFAVIDPFAFIEGYRPILSPSDLNYFQVDSPDELRFLTVIVLNSDLLQTVVNLKSPIVLHPVTNQGKQVIVENPDYAIRAPLFPQAPCGRDVSC